MEDGSRIALGDGAGGELMQRMLKKLLLPRIRDDDEIDDGGLGPHLLDDSASIGDTAFTIDGHTVWPLEFPGGDIGSLSVFGTVNDLWVVGAQPSALALSMVLEEGIEVSLLERISTSIGNSSRSAGVKVVTGDTKVVERGGVKGMFISTAGIGNRYLGLDSCLERARILRGENNSEAPTARWLRDDQVRPGDIIILSGSVGDHGVSLLSFREGYGFETDLSSDLASMGELMKAAMDIGGVVAAKDLTRGGLSNGLNEWTSKSGFGIDVHESGILVKEAVRSGCDMLGLDPMEIGNEGKVILAVVPGAELEVLDAIRKIDAGKDAAIIGKVVKRSGNVVIETTVGGRRIMDPPYGDPVPRIC